MNNQLFEIQSKINQLLNPERQEKLFSDFKEQYTIEKCSFCENSLNAEEAYYYGNECYDCIEQSNSELTKESVCAHC